ncbi:hypothetical protein ACHAXN_002256 [Cyclotella atomus]
MATTTILLFLLLSTATASTPSSGRTSSYTPCPQVPSLHCQNGSTCIAGTAKFSSADLSALPYLQTHEEGYHCQCLPGYIGHECQIEVSSCGGSEEEAYDPTSTTISRCYHGSQCKRLSSGHYCDCETINSHTSSTGNKYAGLMCEHAATSMCAVSLVEEMAPNGQFCTNHGKCIKMVTGNDAHPGCVCREGYTGDRCEYKDDDASSIPKLTSGESKGNSAGKWVLFSLLAVVMLGIAAAVVVTLVRIRREQALPSKRGGGTTPAEVGLGDLEPDGSGTLGVDSDKRVEEGGGHDLEMKESTAEDGGEVEVGETMKEDDHSVGDDSLTLGTKNGRFVIT